MPNYIEYEVKRQTKTIGLKYDPSLAYDMLAALKGVCNFAPKEVLESESR